VAQEAEPACRTQGGRPMANLRVAPSETWRDKTTGECKKLNGIGR
jgi:hypothetical protein